MTTTTEMYETALVLGLGASGYAACELLLGEGTQVTAVDANDTDRLRADAAILEARGATVSLGSDGPSGDNFSVCIVSPGIAGDSDWITSIRGRGIPVISELELAWSRTSARTLTLAITGSNGKSTVAKLCHDAIAISGASVAIGGNYGPAASAVVAASPDVDWLVLEVSSFQLEAVEHFCPDVALLLNVLPNHLDRHGDMQSYLATKTRMFARMTEANCAVVPTDIAPDVRLPDGVGRLTFGLSDNSDSVYRSGHVLLHTTSGKRFGAPPAAPGDDNLGGRFGVPPAAIPADIDITGTMFDNEILGQAAAAVAAALYACGISPAHMEGAAKAFQPLPHRMQEVARIGGIAFVDDSKATNIAALTAALKMIQQPIRLIAGGRLKEKDLAPAKELLATNVAAVYLIGEASAALASAWQEVVSCRECGTLSSAVLAAWKDATAGEVVLLSPACTSFDQFNNFEDRGRHFADLVQSLEDTR